MEIKTTAVFSTAINDGALLMVFLLVGLILLQVIKPLQKLFLPAGLIGGVVVLILGPQVLNIIPIPATWNGIPGPMINIVLTCALFGVTLNKERIKNYAGAVNLIVLTYFAQMCVGVLVGMGLTNFWEDLPYSWGLMTVYTYWGGHGAALTAGTVFESFGVNGMVSLGIILATLGLIVAMLVGICVVNFGIRHGWAKNLTRTLENTNLTCLVPVSQRKSLGLATVTSDSVNGLALQLAIVLFCIFVGTIIFKGLALVPITSFSQVIKTMPSLLYGIVGAIVIWAIMRKTHTDTYADLTAIGNISGVALEFCICAATATLNLKLFANFLAPILIHMVVIIILMVFLCVVLLKRWMKREWFELCLMAFGQGLGSTPSGLALARCVDADHKSTSWEGFGIALGVFVPITSALAAILPMIAMQSEWIPVILGLVMTVICFLFGEFVVRKNT